MPREKNEAKNISELNLHEKLLRIADMAGVLRKNRDGYNYKYTDEAEIQAKVTAGMQKYRVMLYPSLVPGTLQVTPYHYDKPKTKRENGKSVDYTVPVNEIIVSSEVEYLWVNADNPEERITRYWAYIGQMEDASQAFGAGATYGNRYYLLKALQLATTEDDPDEYRSKQKRALQEEEDKEEREIKEKAAKELKEAKANVVAAGTALISKGVSKEAVSKIVASFNNGNGNPNSIKDAETAQKVTEALETYSPRGEADVAQKPEKKSQNKKGENAEQ